MSANLTKYHHHHMSTGMHGMTSSLTPVAAFYETSSTKRRSALSGST